MVDAVHLLEGTNQLMHIVAVLHIAVVESEVAEQIAFAPAVRLTHCGQRRIHATMVLGNRHLVVVDENDHIAALLGGVVEPLKRNRRAEGAVADHRDHIVRLRRAPAARTMSRSFAMPHASEIDVPVCPSTKWSCSLSLGS